VTHTAFPVCPLPTSSKKCFAFLPTTAPTPLLEVVTFLFILLLALEGDCVWVVERGSLQQGGMPRGSPGAGRRTQGSDR
jgi:hypothetical protein